MCYLHQFMTPNEPNHVDKYLDTKNVINDVVVYDQLHDWNGANDDENDESV